MPIFDNLRLGDMAKNEPIPEGTYHVRLDKMDYSEPQPGEISKWTGKPKQPQFSCEFTVVAPEEYLGRKVFHNFTLKKGADFSLRNFLEDGLLKDEDYRLNNEELIGSECLAVLAIERGKGEFEGRDRNNIKKFLPLL